VKALRHPAAHWVLAIVLGAVFVYASHEKIAQPRDFARIVYHYRLLGPSAALGFVPANAFSVTLPWVEALAGLLLIVGVWRREAALTAGLMLVVFLVAVGWALAHGIDIENCGCFTVSGEGRAAGLRLILQDLGLLAAAAILALVPPRPREVFPAGAPAPAPAPQE
jgi:uncharacterized membrane protein YphA (DoxX/SURF4 family)